VSRKSSLTKKSETQIRQFQHWEGPLPPPAVLQQYEQISPGLKDTLIALLHDESKHRREIEKGVLANHTRESKTKSALAISSICLASLMVIVPLACTGYFVLNGKNPEAVGAFVASFGTLAWGRIGRKRAE